MKNIFELCAIVIIQNICSNFITVGLQIFYRKIESEKLHRIYVTREEYIRYTTEYSAFYNTCQIKQS